MLFGLFKNKSTDRVPNKIRRHPVVVKGIIPQRMLKQHYSDEYYKKNLDKEDVREEYEQLKEKPYYDILLSLPEKSFNRVMVLWGILCSTDDPDIGEYYNTVGTDGTLLAPAFHSDKDEVIKSGWLPVCCVQFHPGISINIKTGELAIIRVGGPQKLEPDFRKLCELMLGDPGDDYSKHIYTEKVRSDLDYLEKLWK